VEEVGGKLEQALFEVRRVIAGQEEMLERLLLCLLSGGHLLIGIIDQGDNGALGLLAAFAVDTPGLRADVVSRLAAAA